MKTCWESLFSSQVEADDVSDLGQSTPLTELTACQFSLISLSDTYPHALFLWLMLSKHKFPQQYNAAITAEPDKIKQWTKEQSLHALFSDSYSSLRLWLTPFLLQRVEEGRVSISVELLVSILSVYARSELAAIQCLHAFTSYMPDDLEEDDGVFIDDFTEAAIILLVLYACDPVPDNFPSYRIVHLFFNASTLSDIAQLKLSLSRGAHHLIRDFLLEGVNDIEPLVQGFLPPTASYHWQLKDIERQVVPRHVIVLWLYVRKGLLGASNVTSDNAHESLGYTASARFCDVHNSSISQIVRSLYAPTHPLSDTQVLGGYQLFQCHSQSHLEIIPSLMHDYVERAAPCVLTDCELSEAALSFVGRLRLLFSMVPALSRSGVKQFLYLGCYYVIEYRTLNESGDQMSIRLVQRLLRRDPSLFLGVHEREQRLYDCPPFKLLHLQCIFWLSQESFKELWPYILLSPDQAQHLPPEYWFLHHEQYIQSFIRDEPDYVFLRVWMKIYSHLLDTAIQSRESRTHRSLIDWPYQRFPYRDWILSSLEGSPLSAVNDMERVSPSP